MMSDMAVFISELADVTEGELGALPQGIEHSFSHKFNKKMSRLINAFPSRAAVFAVQHRGRTCVYAALLGIAILSPFVYRGVIGVFTPMSEDDPPPQGYVEMQGDYDIYGMYIEYAQSFHTKHGPFFYNASPDLTGKIHPEPSPNSMSVRAAHISDGRCKSDALLIVNIKDDGEVRKHELTNDNILYTEAEVIYDIEDKNSELSPKMTVTLSLNLGWETDSIRFEKGRRMLVMGTKLNDGSYSPVWGLDSCFYINDSGVQCTELAEGTADITVTSLTDTPACTKYDGLPLYAAVYDMQNGEDILDHENGDSK